MLASFALFTPLLNKIQATYHPKQIWLFGSRARGDARPDSDWDIFVVVDDNTPEEQLDPLLAWSLQKIPASTQTSFLAAGEIFANIARWSTLFLARWRATGCFFMGIE
jgi:hypothetical protein